MLNDLSVGIDHQPDFEKYCADGGTSTSIVDSNNSTSSNNNDTNSVVGKPLLHKVDMQVNVLTSGHWPSFKSFDTIRLPRELTHCVDIFQQYYDAKTSHRRLAWTYSLGHVFVKVNMKKNVYELQITTLQAVVLFYFNNTTTTSSNNTTSITSITNGSEAIGFEKIVEMTNIPDEVVKRILHSLSCGKYKILKRISATSTTTDTTGTGTSTTTSAPSGSSGGKGIKNDDSFVFNDSFR